MKKFGLGLSQLIGPSRSDERHVIPGDMSMYSDGSPPPSPYPGRRAPLPSKVESDLRVACLAVLTNQRPSHITSQAEDSTKLPQKAQLDYAAIKKSIDKPAEVSLPASKRRSTRTLDPDSAEMVELQAAIDPSKFAYKPDASVAELFSGGPGSNVPAPIATANTMKRRDDLLATDPSHHRAKSGSMSQTGVTKISTDRPKASQRSGSHETSDSTPQTDVTEYPWSTSTAPTSAGVTPARNSKRASAHVPVEQDASLKTDATPIDWIRSELDKRRRNLSRSRRPSELEKPDIQQATRPPSRARSVRSMKSVRSIKSIGGSIKDGIKEYIRPGSSSRGPSRPGTRSGSHANHRTRDTTSSEYDRQDRGPVTRPPPRRDWRNWGRSNKEDSNGNSSGDVSRSSSVRGRSENRKGSSTKAELNLNRDLPPLPSLDQWKDSELEREKPTHIVNLRSPNARVKTDKTGQPSARLVRSPVVSEKDEIVAARLGSPVQPKPEVYLPTRTHHQHRSGAKSTSQTTTGVAKTTDTDRDARDAGVRIEFGIEDLMPAYFSAAAPVHSHSKSVGAEHKTTDPSSRLRASPSTESHSRSGSSISHSLSLKHLRSPAALEVSKSHPNLPTTAHSFSKHRKYDKTDIPPALNSNVANQGRKVATKSAAEASDQRYRHMAEIQGKTPPPPVPPKDDKKGWWHLKAKQKKPATWMDQLEKLGIKDGVLLNDEVAGSPIVRY